MGWLQKIMSNVAGAPPQELTFVPSVPQKNDSIPGVGVPIEADNCYLELYLESLRLERARSFATRFHAIAYSFVTLSREGEERARLAAVSKPEKLAELDKDAVDRVITISKQMMAPTPFRGGTVSLEFGLFSVKSGNLLTPVLDLVTRLSSVAGISYVGAIKPFVPLITQGMDLLTSQRNDTALEVGLDTDMSLATSFVAAIIARPKNAIAVEKLSLDEDRRLLLDDKPLDCGYAVFSIRATSEKSDYGEIPELRMLFAAFQSALKRRKKKDAEDAVAAFRLAAIASPDLIPADARRLIEKVERKYAEAFVAGAPASFEFMKREETLAEIGLYR